MDSLRQAVELYYPRVRAKFGWLLRDATLADDLSQEVFARLFSTVQDGVSVRDYLPYLAGIQRNVWLEHLRGRGRELGPLEEDTVETRHPSPAEAAEVQDLHEELQRVLERLEPEEQAVVIGRHFFEMTGEQLSQWLSVPRRTLMDRYNRAMEKLRRLAIEHGVTL